MKKFSKILCIPLTAALLISGCNQDSGENQDNNENTTNNAGNSAISSDYGNIKTIESPAGSKGNLDAELKSGDTYAVISIEGYGDITCKLYPDEAPEGVQNFIDLVNSGYYSGKIIHRVVDKFMMQGGSANGDGLSSADENSFYVEYNTNMRHYYGALCYANAGGINGTQFYIVNNKGFNEVTESTYSSQLDTIDSYINLAQEYVNSTTGDEKAYYESVLQYYTSSREALIPTVNSGIRALKERTDEMTEQYEKVGGTPFLDGGYTVFGQTVDGFDVIDKISKVEVEEQYSGGEESRPVTDIVISSVEIKTY